jgi:hypothetical protein
MASHSGKALILGSSLALALIHRRLSELELYELGALAFALFLVLAPGFGIQYLIYPAPLLMLASPRRGLAYAYLAGLFAGLTYLVRWTGSSPPFSNFSGPQDQYALAAGLLAWFLLARYCWDTLRGAFARALAGAERAD